MATTDPISLFLLLPSETAQSALGSDVADAVITVPFEFGENQKNALRFVVTSLIPVCQRSAFWLRGHSMLKFNEPFLHMLYEYLTLVLLLYVMFKTHIWQGKHIW